jgi:sulfate transport system ATP-binding protein
MPSDSAAVEAEVRHVHTVGPLVRVELLLSGRSEVVEAELSRDAADRLVLKAGETVFARARKLKVFAGDYQI